MDRIFYPVRARPAPGSGIKPIVVIRAYDRPSGLGVHRKLLRARLTSSGTWVKIVAFAHGHRSPLQPSKLRPAANRDALSEEVIGVPMLAVDATMEICSFSVRLNRSATPLVWGSATNVGRLDAPNLIWLVVVRQILGGSIARHECRGHHTARQPHGIGCGRLADTDTLGVPMLDGGAAAVVGRCPT